MRICYVSHSNSHFTRPYTDYFSRRGHEVHLVSLYYGDLDGVVNHHPLRGRIDPEEGKWIYARALPRVRALLRSLRPCIVHAHYASSNGILAALSGVHPLIISARGTDLHHAGRPVRRLGLRVALRQADLVNPVSRSFEPILRGLGVPAERMVTLTHGVETARFVIDRTHRAPGPVRLVCTRRLSPLYDAPTIVRALSMLQNRGLPFHFTFAAGGPQENSLKRLASESGLGGRVDFRGGYGQDDLPALLADADIYVSASLSDGASVSLLEALASGAFPVVSDVPGNREWLTGDRDGLLFEPGDETRLADCLQRAMGDERLRRDAVEINRARVRLSGERATNLARLETIYAGMAGRRDA